MVGRDGDKFSTLVGYSENTIYPSSRALTGYGRGVRRGTSTKYKLWVILMAINKTQSCMMTMLRMLRDGRGLHNRIHDAMRLAMEHNLITFITDELMNGEHSMPDLVETYRSQREFRHASGLDERDDDEDDTLLRDCHRLGSTHTNSASPQCTMGTPQRYTPYSRIFSQRQQTKRRHTITATATRRNGSMAADTTI